MRTFILLLLLSFPVLIPALPSSETFVSEKKLEVQEVEKTKTGKKAKKEWKKELRKKIKKLRKAKRNNDNKAGEVVLTIFLGILAMILLFLGLFLLDEAIGLGTLELLTLIGFAVIIFFMVRIILRILKRPAGG